MDPTIWKIENGSPILTDEAKSIIDIVVNWAVNEGWVSENAGIHIIGSIAANSYSEDSDIDLHFYGDGVDFKDLSPEEFNSNFRKAFAEFAKENPMYADIGGHPIEVYAQPNMF